MACGYGINGLYINGERVEMDDDITVTKSLGNGFFWENILESVI